MIDDFSELSSNRERHETPNGMSTALATANPIDEIRELIERWGWQQRDWEGPDGCCLVGAIEACFGVALRNDFILLPLLLPDDQLTRLTTVVRLLCQQTDAEPEDQGLNHWGLFHLLTYNDDPSTSYEDIVMLLKRASAAWDEEQLHQDAL